MSNLYDADLHMHTTASDGGYTPTELIKKCHDVGLTYVSITDHDTVQGVKEAIEEGKKLGIHVIPGIELSTYARRTSIHILGYGLNINHRVLLETLEDQRKQREERMSLIIERLSQVGVTLHAEDVLKYVDGGSIGRPHIARALLEKGYVQSVSEAFDRFLAIGKPCYVPKRREMTPEEAVELIHNSGGVAVIAHPIYYELDDYLESFIVEMGVDGVEVYHRDHDENATAHYEHWTTMLEEKYQIRLLRTGGSDFHHEAYGRQLVPLGEKRVANELAEELIAAIARR